MEVQGYLTLQTKCNLLPYLHPLPAPGPLSPAVAPACVLPDGFLSLSPNVPGSHAPVHARLGAPADVPVSPQLPSELRPQTHSSVSPQPPSQKAPGNTRHKTEA